MNQDILLSKIVPNATETTWAQAYTTLNVYITLSIEGQTGKNPVATYGKDLLEKLQREFFALDEKSLENIKKAVGNVSKNIEGEYRYSMLVGAIVNNILYIVIASSGQVVIKREEKIGVIASGIEGELHGFSGKLKHDDIIIFETGDFNKKIPLSSLSEYLTSTDVLQIAENITPLIHEDSKGTEGSIILQYKDMNGVGKQEPSEFIISEADEGEDQQPKIPHKQEEQEKYIPENLWTKERRENTNIENLYEDANQEAEYSDTSHRENQRPFIQIPTVRFRNKKIAIFGIAILLILVLVGSIIYQGYKTNQAKQLAEFNKIYQPIKDKFDEGVKLSTLNKSLALEDFNTSESLAKNTLNKLSKGSEEYKKLSDLELQITGKISEIGGGSSAQNVKEFVKPEGKLKSITALTARGGTLTILDKEGEQVATITPDGKVKKTFDIKNRDSYISADDKFIYTMGDTVTSIDRGNGNVKQIIKSAKGNSLDIFGSNVYTLTDRDILKYRAPSYDSSSYFTDTPTFKSTPVSMSISGPIWVLEKDGTVERFTKGKNDSITLSGLGGALAEGAQIYADPDNNNVYILDVKNQRVVVFNEKGEYQNQYEGSFIKDGSAFAIDEKNKIGYVLSGSTVYSFDL